MKTTMFIKREVLNWLFILLPVVYIILVYDRMPPFAPFHPDKEQNIYRLLLFINGVAGITYLLFLIKPALVPKTALHSNMRTYHRIRTSVLVFISLLSLTWISEKIGIAFDWTKIGFLISMGFIIFVANLYPTLPYNFVMGIKNSWTLSNVTVWKKTHRFAGKLYFWGGLAGALYGILFDVHPVPYMPAIYVAYVFALLWIAHLYSYLHFRKLQSENQGLRSRDLAK